MWIFKFKKIMNIKRAIYFKVYLIFNIIMTFQDLEARRNYSGMTYK